MRKISLKNSNSFRHCFFNTLVLVQSSALITKMAVCNLLYPHYFVTFFLNLYSRHMNLNNSYSAR
jgi:hypothetical protein